MSERERAYRARVLTAQTTTNELARLDDALIVVERGRFARVEPWAPNAFAGPVRDLHPFVIVPGFVDAHVHFPQTRAIGSASGPLLDWLETTVFPEEARFHDARYATAVAEDLVACLLEAGTTLAAIFSSSSPRATSILFEALDASGLRAAAGLTLMDARCPDALRLPRSEAIPAARELAKRWNGRDGDRLRFAVTPRFALSCSRELLADAGALANELGLVVQTHVSENAAEIAATREAFPEARDYLDVYERAGLVGERTILAHAIHLSSSEWDRVASARAKIAHCPDSNLFLGSGKMKLAEATKRGVTVGLGSDVGAGRSFDIRRAIAHAYDTALGLGDRVAPAALFRLATLGGAEALGVERATGSIEVGKEADFVALSIPSHVEGADAALDAIAFGDGVRVERVFVRGKRLFARA